jgi:hypothetical protein
MEGLMPSPRPKVTKKSDVPKGEQPKENAKTVKLLLVPTNEIEGGEDIPVGFQINAATIEALGAKSSDLKTFKIDLSWKDSLICTIALTEPVLDLSKTDQGVRVSTRIRIAAKPGETIKGTLSATMTLNEGTEPIKKDDVAQLSIRGNDNPAMNSGQLVLSVQSGQSVLKNILVFAVKTMVPRSPLSSRAVREVKGEMQNLRNGSTTELIRMNVSDLKLLSDQIFLAFNFQASEPALLNMSWAFKDGGGEPLLATAFLPQAGAA